MQSPVRLCQYQHLRFHSFLYLSCFCCFQFFFLLYLTVLTCIYVCVLCVYILSVDVRRGHWIPLNCSFRWLWATMLVLGSKPWSYARTNALYCLSSLYAPLLSLNSSGKDLSFFLSFILTFHYLSSFLDCICLFGFCFSTFKKSYTLCRIIVRL